jgi:hypothetical protein
MSIKGEKKRGAGERRSGDAGERKRDAGERRSSGAGERRYVAGRRRLVGDTKSNGDRNLSGAGKKENGAGRNMNAAGRRKPGVEMRSVGETKSNGDKNMSGAGKKENGAGKRENGGDMNRVTGGMLPQNIVGEYPAAASKHPNNRQAQSWPVMSQARICSATAFALGGSRFARTMTV